MGFIANNTKSRDCGRSYDGNTTSELFINSYIAAQITGVNE